MTHVAYLKRIVAGARRMSDARSCRKRKNQTLLVSKECEMLIKNVITYFQKIFRVHVCGDKHLPLTVATLQDAWWMEDERQRQRSQSIVKSECYVKAGRPGLNHGLSRHHRGQVEGVEGLMGYVPQVVTRKGGMPAPRNPPSNTWSTAKILSEKN